MSKELNEDAELQNAPISPTLLAHSLVQNLFQFLKQTEVHDPSNKIFELCSQEVLRVIHAMLNQPGQAGFDIQIRNETVFFNKTSLKPKPRQFHAYRYVVKFFKERKIGGMRVFTLPTLPHLVSFLWTISKMKSEQTPVPELNRYFKAQGILEFELEGHVTFAQGGSGSGADSDVKDVELMVSLLYKRIHHFIETCVDNPGTAKQFGLNPIQQLLVELMNLGEDDVIQMLRLISLKRYDRPLAYRGVNACFMAIAWARALRLPSGVVIELAGAALAHIISVAAEKNRDRIVKTITQLEEVWYMTDLQRLTLLEWYQPHGENGVYQVEDTRCYAHFFSRMVRILAVFEEMTTFETGKRSFLPDEAIAEMLNQKGSLDPTLMKLFVNWMGVYPVGSLVQLQSGEIAQIFAGASDPLKFQRPLVLVMKDHRGQLLDRPQLLDLSEMNEKIGVYKRSIRRTITKEEAQIPNEHFQLAPVVV